VLVAWYPWRAKSLAAASMIFSVRCELLGITSMVRLPRAERPERSGPPESGRSGDGERVTFSGWPVALSAQKRGTVRSLDRGKRRCPEAS
jgi:hypothetical protein